MENFKIGDRVKGVNTRNSYAGHTGTIVGNDGSDECQWLVDFDGWHGGHSGHGMAKLDSSKNGCYFVYESHIEKIEDGADMEIKVGDIVKVINTGAVYSTYKDWAEEHLLGLGEFVMEDSPSCGTYEVVAIAPHGGWAGERTLYGIREVFGDEGSQVFIIGDYGIELVVSAPELSDDAIEIYDRVMCIGGSCSCIGHVGTVIGIHPDTVCVEYDDWSNGHNANTLGGSRTGKHCWWTAKEFIKKIEGKKVGTDMYKAGDFVMCISRTKENHEKLIVGDVYEVVGCSILDGNIVYSVKDSVGTIFHSMNRFKKVGEGEIPEIDWIRCDMGGTEKKQTCAGAGLTAVDMVSNPPHYTDGGIETIDYLKAKMSPDAFEGFCLGNTMKYISRAGKKADKIEDLKKGKWYLEKLISTMDGEVGEEVDAPCNRPITKKQIGFIAGLTKELNLSRYDLPMYISVIRDYKELSEAEASDVIDKLIAIRDYRRYDV